MFTPLVALALSLTPLAPASQTFTVDDDGPADFASVADALASSSVNAGDTLLIAPGSYSALVIDKPLHLLPMQSEGYNLGDVTFDQVPYFSLIGAKMTGLTVSGVTGTGLIHDCVVYENSSFPDIHMDSYTVLTDCEELIIQRSRFHGTDGCYPGGPMGPEPGMVIVHSKVVVTDCSITGGDPEGFGWGCQSHFGGASPGLQVFLWSDVILASTTVNAGGWTGTAEATAIGVNKSRLDVRGNQFDHLDSTSPFLAVAIDDESDVSVSGVTLSPNRLPPRVKIADPPAPFLRAVGSSGPGETFVLELYGPPSSPALVSIAAPARPTFLAWLEELVWFDPASVLAIHALVTIRQDAPARLAIGVPPIASLVGEQFTIQAWVNRVGPIGKHLTNPILIMIQ